MDGYIRKYINEMKDGLSIVENDVRIAEVITLFDKVRLAKGRIFIAGNGGSSALANHFACDLGKNAAKDEERLFQIVSVCTNMGGITAFANDEGYEHVFSGQLKNYFLNEDDIIVLISSSGNSPNIIKAAEYAQSKNVKVVGFTGFSGGKLKELSDYSIHIPIDKYEIVEDIHGIALHVIVSYFKSLA